jgi:hypothetical protein
MTEVRECVSAEVKKALRDAGPFSWGCDPADVSF